MMNNSFLKIFIYQFKRFVSFYQSPFDYIPLVIQADPEHKPELFEIPLEIARPVCLNHPRYPALASMGLQW